MMLLIAQIIWHRMPERYRTDGSNKEYNDRGPVSGNITIYSRRNWRKPRKRAEEPLAKLWFKAENFCIHVGISVRNAGLKMDLSEDSLAHGNSIITRDSAYQVRRIEACHREIWVL
jgi:hypothetical protein